MDIYATLNALGITYERHDHAPVLTCDEAYRVVPPTVGAAHTKNLFLRDKKGRRQWLLVTDCAKAVDLRLLAPLIGADHLSLASPDRLQRHLGVAPGAVTVLALVNDREHEVQLVVDRDLWLVDRWRCHPLVNTATLVIARSDLERFFAATGHRPMSVDVPTRAMP